MEPTEENLIDTLSEDVFKRNQNITHFYSLLNEIDCPCTISLDGSWGCGKTFFVKQTHLVIQALHPASKFEENIKHRILEKIPIREKESDSILSVYYDAWENDNDSDPILSIIYQICKDLEIEYSFRDKRDIYKIFGSIINLLSGRDFEKLINNLQVEDPIKIFGEEKELRGTIKQFFSELSIERANRMVIFIDELDRCKPSYAISLLERIKHYFNIDGVIFVFSVNISELQHTIKKYYGDNYDACRYLNRFFDIQVSLPPVDYSNYYKYLGLDSNYVVEMVARRIIEMFNFQIRDLSKFYRLLRIAVYDPTHDKNKYNLNGPDGLGKLNIFRRLLNNV